MKRSAGILLSVTSLPSEYGIGSFSNCAYKFIDWLKDAGQTYWQILPLGITGFGDSPYQSFSTFAGNPYLISLEELIEEGLLSKDICNEIDFGDKKDTIDYYKLYRERYKILRIAYENDNLQNESFRIFEQENSFWLEDYSLFMAIKDHQNGKPFFEWDSRLKLRDPETLEDCRKQLSDDILFHKYIQYKFYYQWKKLKTYANSRGIKIIGDIPIYVAHDSADVWANPELFYLDNNITPKTVAGCPPDGFSEIGQLWGNPLYNWDYHKKTGYKWWKLRLKYALQVYDVLRIDHFRGFESFYSIPYGEITAENGKWEKGPGAELFMEASDIVERDKIIAEDLGYMTDSVKDMLNKCGFPGMKVLQFAFDSRDLGGNNEHLPHLYKRNSVVYTGTHDNQTIVSWYKTISEEERNNVRDYLYEYNINDDCIYKSLIVLAMRSVSDCCIIPIQDWMGLDDIARINTPSTTGNNWKWRLNEMPSIELAEEIRKISSIFGRV
ncbi:MAG: 4-alpha-glucanotransferase [Clostridia bacterium]|nr:4-alpha-glucanotransferase [Clostridia bacterium]